ncbi:MAG: hypothetical protein AABZ39_04890 [Spirochaetota bacterium]
MNGKFTLEINLGNAAMSNRWDIAEAVEKVAPKLRRGDISGKIMDENGNSVGKFMIEADE